MAEPSGAERLRDLRRQAAALLAQLDGVQGVDRALRPLDDVIARLDDLDRPGSGAQTREVRRSATPQRLREAIRSAPLGALRADALDGYSNGRKTLSDAARAGQLCRVARGVYLPVPASEGPDWSPAVEAAAAAVGMAVIGPETALMGMSAARLHGALPRAVSRAWVAAPRGHRPIELTRGGTVSFALRRGWDELDLERVPTELGPVLVTTVEQTILDLMRDLGVQGLEPEIPGVVRTLAGMTDPAQVHRIAAASAGQKAAFGRYLDLVG